jgi:hypothetical protein
MGRSMDRKRIGASMVVAVGLVPGAGACEQTDQISRQIQEKVAQGVDAAQEALSDAGDAISGATRSTYEQVRSGVEELQADLADAVDQTPTRLARRTRTCLPGRRTSGARRMRRPERRRRRPTTPGCRSRQPCGISRRGSGER